MFGGPAIMFPWAPLWLSTGLLPFCCQGSPLNRSNLRVIRVNRCHMCVILTTNETSIDDPTLIDKESILCSLNIKTMSFHPGLADQLQPSTTSYAGKPPPPRPETDLRRAHSDRNELSCQFVCFVQSMQRVIRRCNYLPCLL